MTELSHEKVVVQTGRRSGLPIIVAVHSTAFGPAAGGVRMTAYDDWRDGLEDALRLSEAMTLKCAVAQLPFGGGKTVIPLPRDLVLSPEARRDVMLDLGDVVSGFDGRYVCGEDVGTTAYDMAVARERTPYAYCLPEDQGGIGEPSEPTAVGVMSALHATTARLFGTPSPAGRHFTIVGLGQVGGRVARRLAAEGATLSVTDVDASKQALAQELGATWIEPQDALATECDVLVPCAMGGILTAASVETLHCRAVCGAANNQLAETSVADLLHSRGILWAPDFVANGGGVIFGGLVETGAATQEDAMALVRQIGDTMTEVFALADAAGLPPFAAADRRARARVAAAVQDAVAVS
jgi:leucine dehydrogenase